MMRSFELPQYRRVNVWLDEVPPAEFTPTSTVTRVVIPRVSLEASVHRAGVEVYIPHGGMASYGLLGAELVKAAVQGLEVVVSVNKVGFPYRQSLASKMDEVKVGLLDEYASAAVGGIVKVAQSIGAPTKAALRFRWAAHSHVGSSPAVFEKVSAIVVQLLTLEAADVSNERIQALLA